MILHHGLPAYPAKVGDETLFYLSPERAEAAANGEPLPPLFPEPLESVKHPGMGVSFFEVKRD
jgi:hypothetical protein